MNKFKAVLSALLYAIFISIPVFTFIILIQPDDTPPHYADVCVDSTTTMQPMWFPNGNGGMRMVLMPQTTCHAYEPQCTWGADYIGEKRCD